MRRKKRRNMGEGTRGGNEDDGREEGGKSEREEG